MINDTVWTEAVLVFRSERLFKKVCVNQGPYDTDIYQAVPINVEKSVRINQIKDQQIVAPP